MNVQIQKLAEQAGAFCDKYDMYFAKDKHGENGIDLEQFAKLLIQECVTISENYQKILENDPECWNCRKVAYGIADKIKEHFGVEK